MRTAAIRRVTGASAQGRGGQHGSTAGRSAPSGRQADEIRPVRSGSTPHGAGGEGMTCGGLRADLDLQSEVAVSLNADVRGRQKGPWAHHTVALRSPMAAYRVS